ncbi:hypothetical protein AA0120_g10236 [Alternaria tenuissima]|nr:hypothetical protein AA0120_g10236 [Alternaria tenuissima]
MRISTLFTGTALLLGYEVFAATISQNARCGKDFGGVVCPGKSTSVGPCCSQYGWCGRTEDHCYISKGCQSGFGSCSTSSSPSKQPPTSSPSPTPSKLKTSTDGKCGVGSSQTCLSSMFGNCCSQYGYCGNSNAYCGSGCQTKFGSCKTTSAGPSSILRLCYFAASLH